MTDEDRGGGDIWECVGNENKRNKVKDENETREALGREHFCHGKAQFLEGN